MNTFILGCSIIITLPFYFGVYISNTRDYSLDRCAVAPLYFTSVTVLTKRFNLPFYLSGMMSGALTSSTAYALNMYNYDYDEWRKYFIFMFFSHTIVFSIIGKIINNTH